MDPLTYSDPWVNTFIEFKKHMWTTTWINVLKSFSIIVWRTDGHLNQARQKSKYKQISTDFLFYGDIFDPSLLPCLVCLQHLLLFFLCLMWCVGPTFKYRPPFWWKVSKDRPPETKHSFTGGQSPESNLSGFIRNAICCLVALWYVWKWLFCPRVSIWLSFGLFFPSFFQDVNMRSDQIRLWVWCYTLCRESWHSLFMLGLILPSLHR